MLYTPTAPRPQERGKNGAVHTLSETMQTCTGFYQSLRQPEPNSHWILARIIALMLELLGYDAALGSMGQAVGVAENLKLFGGFWPMAGCILTFICYKFIYNLTDDEMRKVSAEVQKMSEEKEAKALAEMNQ